MPEGQNTTTQRTRWDLIKGSGEEPELPDTDHSFLVDWLFEMGPAMHGAMGPVPITFSEIDAWARMTGTILEYGEATLLRHLSQLYCMERQASKGTSPVLRDGEDKSRLAQGIFAALRTRSA